MVSGFGFQVSEKVNADPAQQKAGNTDNWRLFRECETKLKPVGFPEKLGFPLRSNRLVPVR